VRLREGNLSVEEQAAFEEWRASNPQNAAAFEDVLHMYGHLAGMSPSRKMRRGLRSSRRYVAAGAAAFAAASVALFVSFDEVWALLRSDYYASVGERKAVTLEDGSRIELDSKSSIAVRYSAGERRVILLNGEAWFEVAPDASRPFVVEAGGGTVTALGTAFDVALKKSGARVIVTEHSVKVSSGGEELVVTQGEQSAFSRNGGAQFPSVVDTTSATAWRRGKLIVERQPLGKVLSMLGRYRRGFVDCFSPSTCARRVTGVFGSDDPLQSLHEIQTALGLHAIHLTNYIILLY
jgi:transmembrane sensor